MFKVTNLDENKTENTPYHQFLSVKTNRKKANTISNIINNDNFDRNSNSYFKYTVTPNGLNKIFDIITDDSYKANEKIQMDLNLQIAKREYQSALGSYFYTLCDDKYNYPWFMFEIDSKMNAIFKSEEDNYKRIREKDDNYKEKKATSKIKEEYNFIITIHSFSGYYDEYNHTYYVEIHDFTCLENHKYQIYQHTSQFFHPKMNFIYQTYEPIDLSQFNSISHITKLSNYIRLYVRVILKTTITSFIPNANNTHTGNLFFFNVIDKDNSTLRIVARSNNAEYYYQKIKVNKTYEIKGYFNIQKIDIYEDIEDNNPIYQYTKKISKPINEIMIGNDSVINELYDNGSIISLEQLNVKQVYFPLNEILKRNISKIELVSTVGFVRTAGIVTRNTYALRKMKLMDKTGDIDVNLWNQFTLLPIYKGDYIVIRNIQVKKYTGPNLLTTVDETEIDINPTDNEKVNELKEWMNSTFKENSNEYTPFKMNKISPIINKNHKVIEGYITNVIFHEKVFYEGCYVKNCKEKLRRKDSCWFCDKCRKSYLIPNYYLNDIEIEISNNTESINAFITDAQFKEIIQLDNAEKNLMLFNQSNISNKIKNVKEIAKGLYIYKYKFTLSMKDNLFILNTINKI